jgi:zona occludens toxin
MATAIHHGAPGSFKSFTLVQRFVIQALSEGRLVVTNIRGLNDINLIIDSFPEITFPESCDLWYIDSTKEQGRELMAGWFHWLPFGALICIDEAQRIYPDRRDFKLESLDKFVCPPGYKPDTLLEGRPEDVFTAYDMQRHYQWDIFLSTTNIAKVKKEIRESSEWAYFHRRIPDIPFLFKDSWFEFQHDPETNGKTSASRVGRPARYTADTKVYSCYQSTATGEHTESKAGSNPFSNPAVKFKLIGLSLGIVIACFFFVSKLTNKPVQKPASASTPVSIKQDLKPTQNTFNPIGSGIIKNVDLSNNINVNSQVPVVPVFRLMGISKFTLYDVKLLIDDGKQYLSTISLNDLFRKGYNLVSMDFCSLQIKKIGGNIYRLNCQQIDNCSINIHSPEYLKIDHCINPNYVATAE